MIGDRLGDWMVNATPRYAHLARDSVRGADEKTASFGARIMPSQGG